MTSFGTCGPDLQVAMFASGNPEDLDEVEEIAVRARRLFAEDRRSGETEPDGC
jgi:hypothetical protein